MSRTAFAILVVAAVKWVRRYWRLSAPPQYKPTNTDWALVVALR